VILHSQHDDVVPLNDSRELLTHSGLSDNQLVVVGDNHLMVDATALAALREAVANSHQPSSHDQLPVSLAAPGSGLPTWERLFLRNVLLPIYCRFTSWKRAVRVFQKEGARLVEIAESLNAEEMQRRVLIKRPLGLEDSSRYWSAEMVLEHLIEVGSRVAVGVVELTHGEPPSVKADIVEVKPQGERGGRVLDEFRVFLEDYTRMLSHEIGDRRSKAAFSHPWFGHLNAHQWVCLGAVHQGAHRRQMERIVGALRKA
jgi:hypothetical protein